MSDYDVGFLGSHILSNSDTVESPVRRKDKSEREGLAGENHHQQNPSYLLNYSEIKKDS